MNDFFLADDLSGALDAAAAFHRAGRRVRIALEATTWPDAAPDEIVGITTETRNADSATAAAVVRRVLELGLARGGRLQYKKIDSTLRGPVAAEITAITEMLPGTRILFAPANPRVGRTVKNGVLLVGGVPVAETDFGRDPASPLRHSEIRRILGGAATADVAIPDVADEADLALAVEKMEAVARPWVPVGSGALAVPVAARRASPAPAPAAAPALAASPVLMIGGSAHPLNRRQADELTRLHRVSTHELDFAAPLPALHAAIAALRQSGSATLQLPSTRVAPATALSAIVDAAVTAIADSGARRIFATGGETAFALCGRLGVRELVFLAEIEAGLSLSWGMSPNGPLLLAVKPGGFGDANTWIRAWERLRAS